MKFYVLVLGALLAPRSLHAEDAVSTHFTFSMTTDSGVVYKYDADPFKEKPIMLPGAFEPEGWHCIRSAVVMNNDGDGYVGDITCSSPHGMTWGTVICSSTKADHDFSTFHLGVFEDPKIIAVTFKVGCRTLNTKTEKAPPPAPKGA